MAAHFTYTDLSDQVRCAPHEQRRIRECLRLHGVVIVPIMSSQQAQQALMETDPMEEYNQVLRKPITLSRQKIYGLEAMSKREAAEMKFPNSDSGMINIYSSKLHLDVASDPALLQVMKIIYKKRRLRWWPNRLRVQVPFKKKSAENSHHDGNGYEEELDFDDPQIGCILALSDGRPYEFVRGSHTQEFHSNPVWITKYGPKRARHLHYRQFHLENPETPDPLGLRKLWVRVVARAGELILFNTANVHRIAENQGDRAVWSMFISVEPEQPGWDDVKSSLATPPIWKRSEADRLYTCPHQPGELSARDANLFALLVGYQPYRWPSGKPTFYYSNQAINSVKFRDEYMRDVVNKKEGQSLDKRPVWPDNLGAKFAWYWKRKELTPEEAARFALLRIPKQALNYYHWVFNPLDLSLETLQLLGFLDYAEDQQGMPPLEPLEPVNCNVMPPVPKKRKVMVIE